MTILPQMDSITSAVELAFFCQRAALPHGKACNNFPDKKSNYYIKYPCVLSHLVTAHCVTFFCKKKGSFSSAFCIAALPANIYLGMVENKTSTTVSVSSSEQGANSSTSSQYLSSWKSSLQLPSSCSISAFCIII